MITQIWLAIFLRSLHKVSLRVAFFSWSAALSKIFTMDNPRKQHVIVIDRCCMCEGNGKSVDHLLLHYEVARALLDVFFDRFGMSRVMRRQGSTYMRVRGLLIALEVLLCERWCLHVFYDIYAGKEMIEVLRIVKECWRRLKLLFF
jgi:hypothetical protein